MVLEDKDGLSRQLEILGELRGKSKVDCREGVNPAALVGMPAIMPKTARKGMTWTTQSSCHDATNPLTDWQGFMNRCHQSV